MKVYIFGAGASLGSQEKQEMPDNHAAPLVDQLFDPKYEAYANEVYVSPAKIRAFKDKIGDTPLEPWLTAEWTRLGEPHGKETLAAGRKDFGDLALYIWRMMSTISRNSYSENNGYYLFLQKIVSNDHKDENAFVNFNYDTLLDKAMVKILGYDLSGELEKYTNVNYLKPHGSVNWFVDQRSSDDSVAPVDLWGGQTDVLFSRISGNMFKAEPIEKRMKILDPLNNNILDIDHFFSNSFGTGNYGYPLIMLPLSAKMYDLIKGFMERMEAEFDRIFSQATDIYVIGYRANDALFQRMISKASSSPKLHVVGRSTAKQVQDKILEINGAYLTRGEVYDKGFIDFIENGLV